VKLHLREINIFDVSIFCGMLLLYCTGSAPPEWERSSGDKTVKPPTGQKEMIPVGPSSEIVPVSEEEPSGAPEVQVAEEPVEPAGAPVESGGPKAVSPGEPVAVAMVGGRSPSAVLRVASPSVGTIEVSPKVYALNICETKQMNAIIKDKDGQDVPNAKLDWESTDESVAKVDEKGMVTGLAPGYTFIRATNGKVKSNPVSLFIRDRQVKRSC
jgi:hypothetical protein